MSLTASDEQISHTMVKTRVGQLHQPLVLTPLAIGTYLAITIVLAAVLAALYALSTIHHGISDYESHLYYVWTYGPTALFTVLATIWAQLEFRTMQREPWAAMLHKFVPAEDSVLLDYYAYWNVWAMYKAIRHKHHRVVLAVLGTLLISALTIASTALFSPQWVPRITAVPLRLGAAIDPPGNIDLTQVSSMPYYRNLLHATRNITTPLGSLEASIYEPFYDPSVGNNVSASLMPNASYSATVRVLTSYLDCEDATAINNTRMDAAAVENYSMSPTILESASCNDTSVSAQFDSALRRDGYSLYATIGCCSCAGDAANDVTFDTYQSDTGLDWRLFAFAGRSRTLSDVAPAANNSDFVALICKPKVDTRLAELTLRKSTGEDTLPSEINVGAETRINNLNSSSAAQLLLAAVKSFDRTSYALMESQRPYNSFLLPGSDTNVADFFDRDYLNRHITTTVPRIMAQVANSFYFSNVIPEGESQLTGVRSVPIRRLAVREAAFVVTIVGIVLLGIICSILLFIGFQACFPNDPRTTGAIARTLAHSCQLRDVLKSQGLASNDELSTQFQGAYFRTHIDENLHFSVAISGHDRTTSSQTSSHSSGWWTPFSITIPFRVLVLCAPLVLIAVLETCLQLSVKSNGLTTVAYDSFVNYLWLYLPPFLVLGMRTLFGMVDSNVRLFQPFSVLHKGRAPAIDSLMCGLQGRFSISALFIAFRRGYCAVLAATTAMLVAPWMSIVVASLFTSMQTDTTYGVTLIPTERWNFSDPTGSLYYAPLWYPGIETQDGSFGVLKFAGEDAVIPSMILNTNLSFPQWTTGDFVLPSFTVHSDVDSDVSSDANITIKAQLPVIRPNLNCKEVEGTTVNLQVGQYMNGGSFSEIVYNLVGLNLGNLNDNCGYVNWSVSNQGAPSNPYYYGFSADTGYSYLNLTNRRDCPTRLFLISRSEVNISTSSNVTTLACRPRIEQVLADITFNYPSFSFSTTNPPRLVPESLSQPLILQEAFFNTSHADPSRQTLTNDFTFNSSTSSSGMGDIFPIVEQVDDTLLGIGVDPGGSETIDAFTQIAVSYGTSLAQMHTNSSLMDENLNRIYRVVVGQLLKTYGTTPVSLNSTSTSTSSTANTSQTQSQTLYPGTLHNPNTHLRLYQNKPSTRTLEALLAFTTLCIALSTFLMRTRNILPKDPGSILGTMSLLAGASPAFWRLFEESSVMDGDGDDESESEKNRIDRDGNWMFEGWRFRMGWGGAEGGDGDGEGEVERNGYGSIDGHGEVVTTKTRSTVVDRVGGVAIDVVDREVDRADSFSGNSTSAATESSKGVTRRRWCIDVDGNDEEYRRL